MGKLIAASLLLLGVGQTNDTTDGRDVWVSDGYAYVGAGSDGGLQVWDVSDPETPALEAELHDTMDFGRGVEIAENTAYVACRDSNEVVSIDVSDPTNPSIIDRVSTNDGGVLDGARGIDVVGDYVFVAVGHFTDGGDPSQGEGLTVVDKSDPANLSIVANVDGNDGQMFAAGDVVVNGDFAYLSGYQDGVVMVVDVSDPTNPTHNNTFDAETPDARGLSVSENVLFMSEPADDAVVSIDISDPANLSILDSVSDGNLAGARANSITGDGLYISSRSSQAVVWVDISDPNDLSVRARAKDDRLASAYGSFSDGDYVYASTTDGNFATLKPTQF